jgi:hypothetical protein
MRAYIMTVVERSTAERADAALPELVGPSPSRSGRSPNALSAFVLRLRVRVLEPRLVVALLLIAAGIVWAVARGLEFYGLGPANLAYDLDQPPLLLAIVGGWIWHRSQRR